MKKLTYLLFIAIGAMGCSVESVDSTENLLTADMKFKSQQVQKSMHLEAEEICEGDAPVFVFNFPQNENGQGKTNVKIQKETFPESGNWESFKDLTYDGEGPETYTYEDEVLEIGTYSFRVSIGSGGFNYFATLTVKPCCEENFTYVDNENGTYTFTYTVGEDMDDAVLVFTFAQGAYVSGLSDDYAQNGNNGQTYKAVMDLEKCDVLEYTVSLDPNCSGNSGKSNVWTDFTVNEVSQKNDPDDKFTVSCE